jgi:hypothetical protein
VEVWKIVSTEGIAVMFNKNNHIFLLCVFIATLSSNISCLADQLNIIGGGIIGAIEAYYAFIDAKKNNIPLHITIYEKNELVGETTASNIVASLTPDEILAVVPRGGELIRKLDVKFSLPGGIRVDDVVGANEGIVAESFKREVQNYSFDEVGHNQRTQDLLAMGKMSMDLWQDMYANADDELKQLLEESNLKPCREPLKGEEKVLFDGYRIDLIYNVPNAHNRAEGMKRDYEALGYKQCTVLAPLQVMAIDPFLTDFCKAHSTDNVWNNDTVAIWRPGGCFDVQVFLPKFYTYLKKQMGTYTDSQGNVHDCFNVMFGKKVTGVEFLKNSMNQTVIAGLIFEDGQIIKDQDAQVDYVLCPGEAVGTLNSFGLSEPAYAGFAGVSLKLSIDIPQEKLTQYSSFSHCMEVHQEGVCLAWQARFRNNKIFIGVAGTKAFYGDKRPTKDQEFAKNRNLLQLNMINDVLPEFISLALKYDTKGKVLTEKDLDYLESEKIATRWAGVRAVVYDGFPTLGSLYHEGQEVKKVRCTTHLGSGGVSFAHAAAVISRNSMSENSDMLVKRILAYGSSCRTARVAN